MKLHQFTLFLTLLLWPHGAMAQEHRFISSADTPVCTANQQSEWEKVVGERLGVRGIDPDGHRIASFPALRRLAGKNWYPMEIEKQTLCGELHHFNFYNPWSSGDEADWNNFFVPSAPYRYLIDDALPLRVIRVLGTEVSDVWHDCPVPGQPSVNNCMEAEITPDDHFYRNNWFNWTGNSPYERSGSTPGKQMCTYGPWVVEEAHGNRPEIHPSELYWWREGEGNKSIVMMALQDDSNRFDFPSHFAVPEQRPTWWQPWAASPRSAQFDVAFEFDAADSPLQTFSIVSLASRNISTADVGSVSEDFDDESSHSLFYDGRNVLRVEEMRDRDLGVKLLDLCRVPDSQKVRGYIGLATRFGRNSDDGEGYHVFNVNQRSIDDITRRAEVRVVSASRKRGAGGNIAFTLQGEGTGAGSTVRIPPQGFVTLDLFETTPVDGLSVLLNVQPGEVDNAVLRAHLENGEVLGTVGIRLANDGTLTEGQRTVSLTRTITEGPANEPVVRVLDQIEFVYDVSIREVSSPDPGVTIASRIVAARFDEESLRRVVAGGNTSLVADYRIGPPEGRPSSASSAFVTAGRFRQGGTATQVAVRNEPASRSSIVTGIPALSGGLLEVALESGETVQVQAPEVALAPEIMSKALATRMATAPVIRRTLDWLGANSVAADNMTMNVIPSWEIALVPGYAPIRAGFSAPGDDDPVSEALNDALREVSGSRLRELFGSETPMEVEWTFRASNLLTGQAVPVRTGGGATVNAVTAAIRSDGGLPNGTVIVTFPSNVDSQVFELVATATVKDTFGNISRSEHRLASHALANRDALSLIASVMKVGAAIAGLEFETVDALSSLDGPGGSPPPVRNISARQARTFRLVAMKAANDGSVTLQELRDVGSAAQSLLRR